MMPRIHLPSDIEKTVVYNTAWNNKVDVVEHGDNTREMTVISEREYASEWLRLTLKPCEGLPFLTLHVLTHPYMSIPFILRDNTWRKVNFHIVRVFFDGKWIFDAGVNSERENFRENRTNYVRGIITILFRGHTDISILGMRIFSNYIIIAWDKAIIASFFMQWWEIWRHSTMTTEQLSCKSQIATSCRRKIYNTIARRKRKEEMTMDARGCVSATTSASIRKGVPLRLSISLFDDRAPKVLRLTIRQTSLVYTFLQSDLPLSGWPARVTIAIVVRVTCTY